MKIIFLDIDDVICTFRAHVSAGGGVRMNTLDPVALGLIDSLLEIEPETRVVISSSWRKDHSHEEILQAFRDVGFRGQFHDDWCTPIVTQRFVAERIQRGDEIKSWLEKHPEVTTFVCIDDGSDFHENQPLVRITSLYDGLSFDNYIEAGNILYGDRNIWFKNRKKQPSPQP